jgi:hypothetical protein
MTENTVEVMANRQILPLPPSSLTPNTRIYPAYERWLREEAGIIAPKVHVVGFSNDGGAGAGGLGSLPSNSSSRRIGRIRRVRNGASGCVESDDDNGEDATETGAANVVANAAASSSAPGKSNNACTPASVSASAPSASVAKIRQHRGLYSKERIEPGEQFIFIPSRCMIGAEMLRDRGTILLEQKGDGPAGHSDPYPSDANVRSSSTGDPGDAGSWDSGNYMGGKNNSSDGISTRNNSGGGGGGVSPSQTRTEMQNELMMLIEEICRMSTERKRLGGEHEWIADDSVALFLVGCKKIQSLVPFRAAASARPPSPSSLENVGCCNNSAEADLPMTPPCFVPHISMLPHSFPTNRLYYSPEELERMGGEIRTDGKRVTRKDVLKQIENDHAELVDLLGEYYQKRGGIEAAKHVYKYWNFPGEDSVGAWYSCFVLDPVLDLTIDSYKWALRYVSLHVVPLAIVSVYMLCRYVDLFDCVSAKVLMGFIFLYRPFLQIIAIFIQGLPTSRVMAVMPSMFAA